MMKKLTTLMAFGAMAVLFSCNDDDTTPTEVTIADQTFSIDENSAVNSLIGTVEASSNMGDVAFTLNSQSIAGALQLNSTTGDLTVADISAFDYETNTAITAGVTATNNGVSEQSTITVNIIDIADTINSSDQTFSINENSAVNSTVGTFQINSAMNGITYSITNQSVADALKVSGSGEIQIADKSAFDYETNTMITADITAKSGDIASTSKITVNINDLFNLEEDKEALDRIYNANPDNTLDWNISGDITNYSNVTIANNRVTRTSLHNRNLTIIPDEALYNLNELTHLGLFSNQITAVNVSNNTKLEQLLLSINKLTAIDISMLSNLEDFKAHSNNITSANIANGNNTNMWRMELQGNNNLTCIQTDTGFTGKSGWSKPSNAVYSDTCN